MSWKIKADNEVEGWVLAYFNKNSVTNSLCILFMVRFQIRNFNWFLR